MTTEFTLKELLEGVEETEALAELKEILEDQGIDTTDWTEGSLSQTNLQLCAYVYSTLTKKISSGIKSTLNTYSSGSGLTILADSFFDNQRILSEKTQGKMVVSGSSVIFPRTWSIGELIVTNGSFNFLNDSQITLNSGTPVVTASFSAEVAGADYNISTDSTLAPIQTEVGLSITNPAVTGTDSWIEVRGNDEEEDDTLRKRNGLKWTSLQSSEHTVDKVRALAISASADIFYVSVDDQNPRGAFTSDVYVSYQTTTASAADVELVQDKLNNSFFGNSTYGYVSASNATQIEFSSSVSVYYNPSANLAAVKAAAFAAANDFVADIPIGGKNYLPFVSLTNVARVNDLIRDLESVDGVSTVEISPNSDLIFQPNEKLTAPADWNTVFSFFKLAVPV
jgi:phage-related baseplate assembly protein